MDELRGILERFEASGWELIALPARRWLEGQGDRRALSEAIREAERQCGGFGCSLDPLYRRALELLEQE